MIICIYVVSDLTFFISNFIDLSSFFWMSLIKGLSVYLSKEPDFSFIDVFYFLCLYFIYFYCNLYNIFFLINLDFVYSFSSCFICKVRLFEVLFLVS